MNIYALLVALVLITALLMRGYQAANKKYIIIACLLLFTVYGLRDCFSIGNDSSSSYLHQFQRAAGYTWADILSGSNSFNLGYSALNKAVYDLTNGDYQIHIALIAAFVTFCFGRLVYKYSPNPLASILYYLGLMLYTFHFNSLKQSIAMAFLMLAFDQVISRRLIRFLVLTVFASFFHFPAIVFLPAYWIAKIKPGRAFIVLLVLSLLATYHFRAQILDLMLRAYKEEYASVSTAEFRFLRTKVLIMIVIVAAAVLFRKPRPSDFVYCTLLEFMGVAIVFQAFCGYSNVFERLADYYFQFSVIFIPMVFDKHADREPLFGWRLMGVIDTLAPYLFCGFGVYRFVTSTMSDRFLYPFKFFFQS